MSSVASYADDVETARTALPGWMTRSIDRSGWTWTLFLLPTMGAGVSWLAGGIQILTDLSFVLFSALCLGLLLNELFKINVRWGIGAFALYGGSLTWFCYDYMAHWFMASESVVTLYDFTYATLAKAAFYTMLYVMFMTVGLNIRKPVWPEKLLFKIPETRSSMVHMSIILLVFAFGVSPFFIFTREPFYRAIYEQFLAGRGGQGPQWTVGRTGNLNYNWGGYVAQILQVGQAGGVLAILFAILFAKNILQKIICWAIWMLWLLLAIGSGTRSDVMAGMLPPLAAFFFKYQSIAVIHLRRVSYRAYLGSALILLVFLAIVQYQITYRDVGFAGASVTGTSLNITGNSMFSESLLAFQLIPDHVDFFANRLYLEGIFRPMIDQAWGFVISPIPRALWTSKPVDQAWAWYNRVVTGEALGTEGTTVATGGQGAWYIRYGPAGVIEGGILVGWLMALGERLLRQSTGRLNLLLFALGWENWLFGAFRAFGFPTLDALMIAIVVLSFLTATLNIFAEQRVPSEAAQALATG